MMSVTATPDGVLLVDKAAGMTSHDVVALVRRQLQIKKVGHCGTLDPIATGLLILTLGRGTKIQDLLMSEDKEYVGTLSLGQTTDTQDRAGRYDILEKSADDLVIHRRTHDQAAVLRRVAGTRDEPVLARILHQRIDEEQRRAFHQRISGVTKESAVVGEKVVIPQRLR